MHDTDLNSLSLRDLQDLQAQLHIAIRAKIRAQQEAKAHRQNPTAPTEKPNPTFDLARERDAWLARKRTGDSVA